MDNKTGMQVTLTAQESGPYIGGTGIFNGTLKNYEGQEYHCRSISVHVPVGNEADCLYFNDDKTVIASKDPSWNRMSSFSARSEEAVCTLELKDGGARPLKNTLNFTLSGNVNLTEGTVLVSCTYEYSSDGGKTWGTGKEEFMFEKTSSAFYLKNLFTAKPESPTSCCTQFAPGESISFFWESNGTMYEIYKKGEASAIYSGMDTSYTYQTGIDSDTTFLLKAVQTENSFRGKELPEKALRLSDRMLFETITLTTARPVFQEVKVTEKFDAADAKVSMLRTGTQMDMGDKGSRKIQVTTDGFVTGNLFCSGGSVPSSAYIRLSVYRNGRECYTARECAYCADILCAGNKSLTVRKPANVIMPVAAGDTLILECSMESPSGELKKNGYEAQWFFLPEGKGEATVL